MHQNLSKNTVRDFVTEDVTKSQIALTAAILGLGIIGANPAQAASLVNGTGISNPGTTITFSEISLATNTALTPQDYSSLGVTFTGLFVNHEHGGSGFPNIDGDIATNFDSRGYIIINPFIISFAQSQSQAAFSMVTNPGTSTFEALLNGSVVDSFSSATDLNITDNFYGFTGVTFDSIRITAGGIDVAAGIDNIQFNSAAAENAPEPFTIIGTLVGGTAAVRMKKKLKSTDRG